jgi:lipoate-protein ligase A
MPFCEPRPDILSPNPGGADDPLGESVLDPGQPPLRIFEPRDCRLVIGRHQDPERELLVEAARRDGVPMHRRLTGGGAVVLAPGMLVIALRLPRGGAIDALFSRINQHLITAIGPLGGAWRCLERGHGDLALAEGDDDPAPRKICGASLRQTREHACYLGVLLVDDASALMERYLAAPSRRPEYRGERGHGSFCTALAAHGLQVTTLREALCHACQPLLAV